MRAGVRPSPGAATRSGRRVRILFEVLEMFTGGQLFMLSCPHAPLASPARLHERAIPRFDLIVLDPPSFTRNRASVGDALRGYKEIHLRALKLLKPGGTLATSCCSYHVDAVTFQDVILSAAFDTRRVLRRVATYSQPPDHPIIPTIPETEYLKGFAFELVRQPWLPRWWKFSAPSFRRGLRVMQ